MRVGEADGPLQFFLTTFPFHGTAVSEGNENGQKKHLRRLKKVQECQRRKDSKWFKIYNCFLIDSRFGYGYGMVALSKDWIVQNYKNQSCSKLLEIARKLAKNNFLTF